MPPPPDDLPAETGLVTTEDEAGESGRLYQRPQSTVDEQILHTDFVSPADDDMDPTARNTAQSPPQNIANGQRDPILKIVEEHRHDVIDVEALAVDRYGRGVRLLNKVEVSGLVVELLDTRGGKRRNNGSVYQESGARRDAAWRGPR